MASKVQLLSTAVKDFAHLSSKMRTQIANALADLTEFPVRRSGIKKLKPPFEGYRKRVGEYRILFDYNNETVFVHRIKDQKDAYR